MSGRNKQLMYIDIKYLYLDTAPNCSGAGIKEDNKENGVESRHVKYKERPKAIGYTYICNQ